MARGEPKCDEATAEAIRELVAHTMAARESAGFVNNAVILSLDVWDKIRYAKTHPFTFHEARNGLNRAYMPITRADGTETEIRVILISDAVADPDFIEVI